LERQPAVLHYVIQGQGLPFGDAIVEGEQVTTDSPLAAPLDLVELGGEAQGEELEPSEWQRLGGSLSAATRRDANCLSFSVSSKTGFYSVKSTRKADQSGRVPGFLEYRRPVGEKSHHVPINTASRSRPRILTQSDLDGLIEIDPLALGNCLIAPFQANGFGQPFHRVG
jgi:hypothetical protein